MSDFIPCDYSESVCNDFYDIHIPVKESDKVFKDRMNSAIALEIDKYNKGKKISSKKENCPKENARDVI